MELKKLRFLFVLFGSVDERSTTMRHSPPVFGNLAAEAVEGPALPLERVHDVHGRDGLPPGVLSVRHRVADNVLEEHLEDTAGLLVDGAGDALHTAPPREPADRGLGDALDVVAQHLAVTLGSALAEPLASLSTSSLHSNTQMQTTYGAHTHDNSQSVQRFRRTHSDSFPSLMLSQTSTHKHARARALPSPPRQTTTDTIP